MRDGGSARRLERADERQIDELADLMIDAGGASVGFMRPLAYERAVLDTETGGDADRRAGGVMPDTPRVQRIARNQASSRN